MRGDHPSGGPKPLSTNTKTKVWAARPPKSQGHQGSNATKGTKPPEPPEPQGHKVTKANPLESLKIIM